MPTPAGQSILQFHIHTAGAQITTWIYFPTFCSLGTRCGYTVASFLQSAAVIVVELIKLCHGDNSNGVPVIL